MTVSPARYTMFWGPTMGFGELGVTVICFQGAREHLVQQLFSESWGEAVNFGELGSTVRMGFLT